MIRTRNILPLLFLLIISIQLVYFIRFKETLSITKTFKDAFLIENTKLKIVEANCSKSELPKTKPLYMVQRSKNRTFFYKEDIKLNNSIFFVESSGRSDLLLKELCAVESAAKLNPKEKVYFIMTNRTEGKDESNYKELMAQYKNLKFAPIDLVNTFRGSILEHVWFENKIQNSPYYYGHLSDVLRMWVLHQYGGTYIDIDTIVLKQLPTEYNFASTFSGMIANGIMRFSAEHPVLKMILDRIANNYNGLSWNHNGGYMLTDMIFKLCKANSIKTVNEANCHKIKILPSYIFYPIMYPGWKAYFDPNSKKFVEEHLKNTLIAHYWGSQTSKAKIKPGMPLHDIALEKCPIIAKKFK